MTETNVFDKNTTTQDTETPEILAKRLKDKDDYIARLEAENAEARAEAAKSAEVTKTVEELRAEFAALKAQPQKVTENTTPLPADKIRDVVFESMNELKAKELRERNQAAVSDMLAKKYGDAQKAKEALTVISKTIGVGVEFLADVAAKSPSAFAKLVGMDEKTLVSLDTTTSVLNTQADRTTVGDSTQVGTKAYFDKMRKENPIQYWQTETQVAIWKAAKDGVYKTK